MKVIAFANRLLRDLKEKDLASLAADARLELVDAINTGLQKLHALSPPHSKITTASIALGAPSTVTMDVIQGSRTFTGYLATQDDLYCTVMVNGDGGENQIASSGEFLHPYAGDTGTVQATIYYDASVLPQEFEEIISPPQILENREFMQQRQFRMENRYLQRQVRWPRYYRLEPNAANQNPPAPAVFRTESLPDQSYRLEMQVSFAPLRVGFTDLLTAEADMPLRDAHIEAYLLPICRAELTTSTMWRTSDTAAQVQRKADEAELRYSQMIPTTLATPSNRVGTAYGF